MSKTITVALSANSIDGAIRELENYRDSLKDKAKRICEKLAFAGEAQVSLGYASAIYDGEKDVSVSVEEIPDGYKILADGETALILEFGAGVTNGYGHPQAGDFGMGPGTYPEGKGHWDDPRGWWIPKDKGGGHTYGNPPTMAMYETAKALRERVLDVAREVFNG